MNLSTWQRIQEVFESVVDLPASERDQALAERCGNNATLRRMVESLILCETGSGLENIVQGTAASLVNPAEPQQIGSYRILARLGEGGMGVVYEAEQSHPKRKVALKVMRSGNLATEREKRLFEREADALGRLQHPGIATIYESGLTPEGQPFLVMEFVAGQTLLEYVHTLPPVDSFRPQDVASRIELFLNICEAITYAHQQGVIHRDLKPGNIMVTSRGEIKVLDFGLARLTDDAGNTRTETGIVQGSLRYMSPEQARGETGKVDTRSDIYSLGIILYELLSGKHPYLDKTDLLAAIQQICETPVKPLRAEDLDTILAKALAKDPAQRYDSVAALAADLRRFLRREAILARPATIRYQLRMLVGRNRLAAAAFAALVMLILVFGIVSFTQALRIRAERDRANQQAAMANEVSNFLVNLYRETNPVQANGVLTARDLLVSGRKRLEKELRDKPEIRARLLENIGSAFSVVGPMEEAVSALEESLKIRGLNSPESASSWNLLGIAHYNLGQYEKAVEASRNAVRILKSTKPVSASEIPSELNSLALSLAAAGKHAEAVEVYREIEALDRKYGREDDPAAIVRLSGYGSLLRRMGRISEAVEKLENANERLAKHPFENSHLRTWNDLGTALNMAGRPAEGEIHLRRLIEKAEQLFGSDHANIGILEINLGYSLAGQHRWAEAAAAADQSRKLLKGKLPEAHATWIDLSCLEAEIAQGQGESAKALTLLNKALEQALSSNERKHPQVLRVELLRGKQLLKMGQPRKALPLLEEILPSFEKGSWQHQQATEALQAARKALV